MFRQKGIWLGLFSCLVFTLTSCGGSSGELKTILAGDVFKTANNVYEATGEATNIVIAAVLTKGAQETRNPENASFHVSPEEGGAFADRDDEKEFIPVGPGTYEIWTTTEDPDLESPRLTLIIPKNENRRVTGEGGKLVPYEVTRNETVVVEEDDAGFNIRVNKDGSSVGYKTDGINVELSSEGDEKGPDATPPGQRKKK